MSTAIATWLNTRGSFAHGVALLTANGEPDEDLMFLLSLGETTVSTRALVAALEARRDAAIERTRDAHAGSASPTSITKADIVQERRAMGRNVQVDGYADKELPPALREVHGQLKTDFREMDFLRHRLEMLPNDNDRLRDALRVVDLDDAITSAYARLDAWDATGRDPGDSQPVATPKNGAQLHQELKNISTYLSRHKSGARPLSPERERQFKERQAALKALIDALP